MPLQQKKIKKRELKQDPLMKAISDVQFWLSQHGMKLGIAVGVVLVAGLVYWNVTASSMEQKRESVAALARVGEGIGDLSSDQSYEILVQRLDKVATEYAGTSGGAEALISIARYALETGDDQLALERFERFLNEYDDTFMLTTAAMMGRGTALENLGRFDEAAGAYAAAAAREDAGHVEPFLQIARGRSLGKAGQEEQARQVLEGVVEESDDARIANEAKRELARLQLGLAG